MGDAEGTKVVVDAGADEIVADGDVDSVAEEETYKGSIAESSAQK